MKTLGKSLLAMMLAVASTAALAARTVTLSVSGMTCSTCPIQVEEALSRVPGVSAATASLESRQAVVRYDEHRTSVEALMKATADIGFPSAVKK